MSKFSTPFLNKSPLEGAYTSGAGGKVYVSNRQAFQKLQDDIVSGAKEGEKVYKLNKAEKDFKDWYAENSNATKEAIEAKKVALGLINSKDNKEKKG